MDPYMESQGLWRDLRHTITNDIRESLGDQLPEAYEARIHERIHLVEAVAERPLGFGRSSSCCATRHPFSQIL
jgi:hypothetical protein